MSGTSQPPAPNDTTPQTLVREFSGNRQEDSDAQRSLQEASVALEVAYNRIRQVRRSLIELSESLPNPDTLSGRPGRVGTSYDGFGPAHDALLLSGGSQVEQGAGLHSIPSPMPPDRNLTSMNQPAPLVPNDSDGLEIPNNSTPYPSRSPADSPPSFQSFVTSNVLPPRFSRRDIVNDAQYLERRGLHDSSATTRGLRVAAREANAQMTMDLSVLSAEYERILALQRDFDLPNVPSFGENSARWERSNRIQRNLDPRDGRRSIPAPSIPPSAPPLISWRAQDSRRWRMRLPMRPFSAEASDRLQSLSNPTMNQDILGPPLTTLRPPQSSIDPTAVSVSGGAAELSRRYRYPTRGNDAENDVNIDWSDEDFISWVSPAQDQYFRDFPTFLPRNPRLQNNAIRVTRTTDTAVSSPETLPPRRGWARLDPDGNEISADEEEELERSRTEYRIRALEQAGQNIATQSGELLRSTNDHLSQRTHYGSVLDSTLNIPDARQSGVSSPFPYTNHAPRLYVDPLPMPLASMIIPQKAQMQEVEGVDIIVPRHACLAGR